jgi:hypothetical protein
MTNKLPYRRSIAWFLSLFLLPVALAAQSNNEALEPLQNIINELQKRFQKELNPVSMDKGVKNLLKRFLTVETDSLQDVIEKETGSPVEARALALKSHAKFLDAFRNPVTSGQFGTYNIRDMRIKYLRIWDMIRHDQPVDTVMASMGPLKCRMIALSFNEYPQGQELIDQTVIRYAQYYPLRIENYLKKNPQYKYTDSLIFIWANRDPQAFVNSNRVERDDALYQRIKAHPSPLVRQLLAIAPLPNVKMYLPFAVQLMNGEMTTTDIDKLRLDPEGFYKKIVDAEMNILAAQSRNEVPLYRIPTKKYLDYYAVKFYANNLNALHEETNSKRFASLDKLRPEDIYFILVSGEDEMYTSSYLYTYNKLMSNYKKYGSDSLLRHVYYTQARQFVRLAGRYNTLSSFLHGMQPDTMQIMLKRLFYGLENKSEEGMEEIMNVAETFPVFIADSTLSGFVLNELKTNLRRVENIPNYYGIKAYSLLIELYGAFQSTYFKKNQSLPPKLAGYLKLPYSTLPDSSGVVNQVVFFYGDPDGKSSYESFLTNFRDSALWRSERNKYWITISSKKGFPTRIYANLPLSNDDDLDKLAQDSMLYYMDTARIRPHIFIHRGHSYHLSSSVDHVSYYTKLAILGSCGGYREIFSVLQKSADAQVISTKQVGSKLVNEPMIRMINEYLLNATDINWTELWEKMEAMLKKDQKAYAYFVDYVPPNKNVGLLVSRLFKEDGDILPDQAGAQMLGKE